VVGYRFVATASRIAFCLSANLEGNDVCGGMNMARSGYALAHCADGIFVVRVAVLRLFLQLKRGNKAKRTPVSVR
jgi:cytochrome b561